MRTVEHDTVPQSRNSTYAVALNQGTEYDCCGKDAVTTLQPESEVLYVHPPCACFAVAATADFPPWCPCVHGSMVCENTAAGKCAITLHGLQVKPQLLQLRTKLGAGALEPTASQYAWEVAVCDHDEVQTIAEDGHLTCSPCPPGGSCDGTNMSCTRVHLLVPPHTHKPCTCGVYHRRGYLSCCRTIVLGGHAERTVLRVPHAPSLLGWCAGQRFHTQCRWWWWLLVVQHHSRRVCPRIHRYSVRHLRGRLLPAVRRVRPLPRHAHRGLRRCRGVRGGRGGCGSGVGVCCEAVGLCVLAHPWPRRGVPELCPDPCQRRHHLQHVRRGLAAVRWLHGSRLSSCNSCPVCVAVCRPPARGPRSSRTF